MDSSTNIQTTMTFIILLTFLLVSPSLNFKNFGMNKPHFLFHLGDRRPVSNNIGWGYWSGNDPLRLKYQNINDDIYAHMIVHDGENIFQQHVEDRKSKINTQIRYQITEQSWESEIEMENNGDADMTWFTYMSIQNNDYKLVDHEKYTSYIFNIPQYVKDAKNKTDRSNVKIDVLSFLYPNQTLKMKYVRQLQGQNKDGDIKMFGISANISETYTINQISQTFKHLVRVERGEEKIQEDSKEKSATKSKQEKQKEKKILEWQRKQIQLMKEDKWEGRSIVVLFLHGQVKKGEKGKIYLTNATQSSSKFNHDLFNTQKRAIEQFYQTNVKDNSKVQFVKHVISNLYGGMTFYYGRLYTQNSLTVHRQDFSYSFTPSRLIFPRSFLWDDGFHQSVIVHYNPNLVLDVLTNWINKIDIFGWIGREQIRGSEISSMMPDSRFVFQDWFQMNPPTLMLSLISLIEKSNENPLIEHRLQLFLSHHYRKLQLWYRYFKNTQSHQSLSYEDITNSSDRFFRWHCKDECSKGNFMGSGLDDYPRRQNETQISKQHVDLVSWLYFFSNSLSQIGGYMEKAIDNQIDLTISLKNKTHPDKSMRNKFKKRVQYYKQQSNQYIQRLYKSFFDSSDSLFKDVVVTKGDLFIEKFVNKIGYINLFPFFTGMLSEQNYQNQEQSTGQKRVLALQKCIQVMNDQNLLLSEDGLRSLSFSDPLYGTDQNYWRGAVWLPINYMVLRACKLYYWNDKKLSKQIQQFYNKLRERLINSVYKSYKDTGYLYENYYEGHGHRGFPFYGWTSTIVNIIAQQY